MSLRHDDELPFLTPEQQAEALRVAMRLQTEATTTRDFLVAAEEAGIEPQYLEEAIRRLPTEAPVAHRSEGEWAYLVLLLATLIACSRYLPVAVPLLISFLFALVPCSMGRSRARATALVFGGWLLADVVFLVYCVTQRLEPGPLVSGASAALGVEVLASVAGTELARQAYRLQARSARRGSQSLR